MVAKAFSTEDGDLTSSIISTRARDYLDVDLTFNARPSGDVYKKQDAAAVKQAVKNLLLTSLNEKPFQPNFGANLNDALFSLDTEYDPEYIQDLIYDAITNYEPRARVLSIDLNVQPDYNSLDATVNFQVVNTAEIVALDVSLARLR
jgi:phage baseplate assembly protein W|tara:strand:+ start:1047 stop:1487 length:441 start_codon:yes stop_codon:yes gene_type:complete